MKIYLVNNPHEGGQTRSLDNQKKQKRLISYFLIYKTKFNVKEYINRIKKCKYTLHHHLRGGGGK